MNIQKIRTILLFVLSAVIFSSCTAIAAIFKTGVGVGVFLVVMVVLIIGIIAMRVKK